MSIPEVASQLSSSLDDIPRVDLTSVTPTPLEYVPTLSADLGGPDIYIKRDDLTGLAFGGNKSRMFEFSLADAIDRGADVIVSGAAVQSNYCRQLSAACAMLDLDLELYLRPVRPIDRESVQGNHLLMQLCGAEVTILDREDDQQAVIASRVEELHDHGRSPYWPRRPETIDLDAIAYVDAALEMYRQFHRMEIRPKTVYVASSDTTQAGLQLGFHSLGLDIEVRGFHPAPGVENVEQELCDIANQAAERLELDAGLEPGEFWNDDSFAGERYGIPTDAAREAVYRLARTEGILLDPVYTGKAMSALIDHVEGGQLDADNGPTVFVHTGGQPALFAYAETLHPGTTRS